MPRLTKRRLKIGIGLHDALALEEFLEGDRGLDPRNVSPRLDRLIGEGDEALVGFSVGEVEQNDKGFAANGCGLIE